MSTTTPGGPRPRPVLFYGMINTAVLAFLGGAGAVDLIPDPAVAVIALAWAVVGGAWAFYVQSVTTPTADPQDYRGVPLVPADTLKATPGTYSKTEAPSAPGLGWTGPGARPDA